MSNFGANGKNIRQPGRKVVSFTWNQRKKVLNMLATNVTFKKPVTYDQNRKVLDDLVISA